MRNLIGNHINTKSVITNIRNGVYPNITILYGEYGSGKTEFAIDIAKMLTCNNLTDEGYCGVCDSCKEAEVISNDTFLSKISITNMTMVDQEKVFNLVKENSSVVHSGNKIYIYDEFHAVKSNLQEMWLSESNKLGNTFLILTTTKLRLLDKGIVSRSVKLKMRYLPKKDSLDLLAMYQLDDINPLLLDVIYDTFRGSPRDMILSARYCKNSGLSLDEQIELVLQYKKAPIEDLILLLPNKVEYFKCLRDMSKTYTQEEIVHSAENFLWDMLAVPDELFKGTELASLISKNDLIRLMLDIKKDATLAFATLFTNKRFHQPGDDKHIITDALHKAIGKKDNGETKERSNVERW